MPAGGHRISNGCTSVSSGGWISTRARVGCWWRMRDHRGLRRGLGAFTGRCLMSNGVYLRGRLSAHQNSRSRFASTCDGPSDGDQLLLAHQQRPRLLPLCWRLRQKLSQLHGPHTITPCLAVAPAAASASLPCLSRGRISARSTAFSLWDCGNSSGRTAVAHA